MKRREVRCYDCGFLALRAAREGQYRAHSSYMEAEQWHRDEPDTKFNIVPGDTNAVHPGEMVCFRRAADLPFEMSEVAAGNGGHSAREVITKFRQCAEWQPHRPGVEPLRQWNELESDRRTRRDHFLTLVAIACAIIVGLMAMTKDSFGFLWVKALVAWLRGL